MHPDFPPFEEWCIERAKAMFTDYWLKILSLELLFLQYIRSLCKGNSAIYEIPDSDNAWMFALDHTNYSRWLPIHISNMTTLNEKYTDIAAEFKSGHFCTQNLQPVP